MGLLRFLISSRHALARTPALLRDNRVPLRLKLFAIVAALVIISPLNILGDIPFLGFFDDAALLGLLVTWFAGRATRYSAARQDDDCYGDEMSRQTLMVSR